MSVESSITRKKRKLKTKEDQARYREISDRFLLYRLGLTDDDNPFWDWKLSNLDEIPKTELIQPDFDEAVAEALRNGCIREILYSCVNYFRYAASFQLADQRTLKGLGASCVKIAKSIGRHHKEIANLSRALRILPPQWRQARAEDDFTVEFDELWSIDPPEDHAIRSAQALLGWCAKVVQNWESPNPSLLANGALPLSVYVDMIYSRPSLTTARNKYKRGRKSVIAGARDVVQLLTSIQSQSAIHNRDEEVRDIDHEALKKNLANFMGRSPLVYSQLRKKLFRLHQFATKR
jgi:hypothetical protein